MEKRFAAVALGAFLAASPAVAQEGGLWEGDKPTSYELAMDKKVEACAKNVEVLPDGRIKIICRDYGTGDGSPNPTASAFKYTDMHNGGKFLKPVDIEVTPDPTNPKQNIVIFGLSEEK